jgi:hypothetical protein
MHDGESVLADRLSELSKSTDFEALLEGLSNVKLAEPPSCDSAALPLVFIGRNRKGGWVAQQQNGLYGGLFVTRAQAIKYALFENGRHPEAIVEVSREIELDMSDARPSVRSGDREPDSRQAAYQ